MLNTEQVSLASLLTNYDSILGQADVDARDVSASVNSAVHKHITKSAHFPGITFRYTHTHTCTVLFKLSDDNDWHQICGHRV